jgi:hypothetical protein
MRTIFAIFVLISFISLKKSSFLIEENSQNFDTRTKDQTKMSQLSAYEFTFIHCKDNNQRDEAINFLAKNNNKNVFVCCCELR